MITLYLSTVQYDKTLENGLVKKVSEKYLVDALSFTEAEARTIEELIPYISGDFGIARISSPRFSEIILNENADKYYKAKANMIILDEKSGTEKKKTIFVLVQANTLESALNLFWKQMKDSLADIELVSLAETAIVDYFKNDTNGKEE